MLKSPQPRRSERETHRHVVKGRLYTLMKADDDGHLGSRIIRGRDGPVAVAVCENEYKKKKRKGKKGELATYTCHPPQTSYRTVSQTRSGRRRGRRKNRRIKKKSRSTERKQAAQRKGTHLMEKEGKASNQSCKIPGRARTLYLINNLAK